MSYVDTKIQVMKMLSLIGTRISPKITGFYNGIAEKIDFSSSFLWAMTTKFCCKARANG